MKKTSYFLFLLSLFICLVTNVNAETSTKNVTVGDVEEPIYSVEIHWSDMKFDWKYQEYTKQFEFTSTVSCIPVTIAEERAAELNSKSNSYLRNFGLYSDNECSSVVDDPVYVAGNTYYERSNYPEIFVIDNSINGQVKAKATFSPSSKYNWVYGTLADGWGCLAHEAFGGLEDYCSYGVSSENESLLSNGYLPYNSRYSEEIGSRVLQAYMTLQYDTASSQTHNVVKDELIGTVTLEISPDLG